MVFTEFRFLLFFAVVFAVYWLMRSPVRRKLWLLVTSYVFYGAWDVRFLSLIIISTLVDYGVGIGLSRTDDELKRRRLLLVSVVTNLGILGFFKYFGFFAESASTLLDWLGFTTSQPTLDIVLPVGISFYTFQTMSYSIDVYRKKLAPTRNLLDLAVFVAFFPQLVAGPIVRAIDFMPQLARRVRLASIEFQPLLALFLAGYVKKAVIADNAGLIADQYFANPEGFSAPSAIIAVLAYAVQIYGDFSGYSDMAIACAGMLGYRLPLNFAHPYFAINITDFWRRWHISLSTWLRDYLYIPLGGSRGSRLFTYRNLMITMLLGGLWHGAAWRFVAWGGLHGVALIVHRWYRGRRSKPVLPVQLGTVISSLFTFGWVCIAWIFFRAEDLGAAMTTLSKFLWLDRSAGQPISAFNGAVGSREIAILLLVVLAMHFVAWKSRISWSTVPRWAFAGALGFVVPFVFVLVPSSSSPFIYFQF